MSPNVTVKEAATAAYEQVGAARSSLWRVPDHATHLHASVWTISLCSHPAHVPWCRRWLPSMPGLCARRCGRACMCCPLGTRSCCRCCAAAIQPAARASLLQPASPRQPHLRCCCRLVRPTSLLASWACSSWRMPRWVSEWARRAAQSLQHACAQGLLLHRPPAQGVEEHVMQLFEGVAMPASVPTGNLLAALWAAPAQAAASPAPVTTAAPVALPAAAPA